MRTASSQATREGQQARLRTIHDLDAAAQMLSEVCQVVLDETQDPATLRERIYARVPAEHLQTAVTTIGELTRPPDDTYAQELLGRYLMMRRFLPTFWRTLDFDSTPGGRPTLHAVQFLQRIEGRPRASLQAAPRAVIPRSWQRYVLPRGSQGARGGCGKYCQSCGGSGRDPVSELYSGKKAGLKPLHDALMTVINAFGND